MNLLLLTLMAFTMTTQPLVAKKTVSKNARKNSQKNLKRLFMAAPIESREPLLAIGTISDGNPYKGVALMKNTKTLKIKAFRVGDTIFFGGKLVEVSRTRILYEKNQSLFYIMVGNNSATVETPKQKEIRNNAYFAEPGMERNQHHVKMTQNYRDDLVKNKLKRVLFQAEAAPYIVDRKIAGFRLLQIDKDSIFDKFGLINRDIITHINGTPLNNVATTINFLHSLKDDSNITLTVKRGQTNFDLSLQVE